VKTTKEVGIHSPTCSIWGVEGRARALKWGLGIMTSKLIIHTTKQTKQQIG